MAKRLFIVQEYDNYQPSDVSELHFRRKGGGWLGRDEVRERLETALSGVVEQMYPGDNLTIMIEVETPAGGQSSGQLGFNRRADHRLDRPGQAVSK